MKVLFIVTFVPFLLINNPIKCEEDDAETSTSDTDQQQHDGESGPSGHDPSGNNDSGMLNPHFSTDVRNTFLLIPSERPFFTHTS